MTLTIRLFMLSEAVGFALASLVHRGALGDAYTDAAAATAEATLTAVLGAGLALTWGWPARTRAIGLGAQAFALVGTFIGAYLAVIGVGPHTVPDVVFHVGMLLALIWGLAVAAGAAADGAPRCAAAATLVTVVQMLTRATGLLQLALGLAFWVDTLLVAVPFHMVNGLLFVLLLVVQAVMAARAGAPWRLVIVAVAWALFVVVLGVTQGQLLPGDWHWLVRVAHLAVGLAAMGLAERLAAVARARLAGEAGSSDGLSRATTEPLGRGAP